MSTFCHQKITFVAILILSIHRITTAQFLYQDCYDGFGTYDVLSDYGANLNEAITQLASLASTFYYNTVSVGKGFDKVNALFYCRYDITSDDCQSCVQSTLENVPLCFQSVESIQFYQECTVHYSNSTIFKTELELPRYSIHGLTTIDDTEYSTLLSTTFSTLISDAVAEFSVSSRYFATGTADYSITETIYALAQCNEDLTSSQCNECLQNGFGNFTENYPGAFMGQVFMPSCRLSYKLSSVSMSSPYDFSVPIIPDAGTIPPKSSTVDDSPPPPPSVVDEEAPPPPPSSSVDEDVPPPSPIIFADEVAPPPPSHPYSLLKSRGTRRRSTKVASFFIVLVCFGLII